MTNTSSDAGNGLSLPEHFASLYDRGLYLQTHALLEALEQRPEIGLRLLAARARGHLGERRKADAIALTLWRANRNDPEATVAYLRNSIYRRGPYHAWRLLNRHPLPDSAPPACRGDWYSIKAYILGTLRDFENAQAAFAQAIALAPEDPWIWVEWSYVCEMRDRYDEGLAAAETALSLCPGFRAAVQSLAHFKTLTGADDEALALLGEAGKTSESAHLLSQLYDLQFEQESFDAAWQTLERIEQVLPLADQGWLDWLAQRRADVALRQGNKEVALRFAKQGKHEFYDKLALRLESGFPAAKRVRLPVGFVRQHYVTCAPATLSALSRYWKKPAEHLDIAEQICYDGTPHHSERFWAESNGFIAREFTVDWATSCALIDAGIPFTLTTVYTGSSHLQAVIGYDAERNSLLIRDPFKRSYNEFEADALFESHRAVGPRGMLLLPPEESARLQGIVLPDCEHWDQYHRIMTALKHHRREEATKICAEMAEQAPEHRLTVWGKRSIAMYDGNEPAVLATTVVLLESYPKDTNLQLSKAASIALIGTRREYLEWMDAISTPPCDPFVSIRYAQMLAEDGRERKNVEKHLHNAFRYAPTESSAWHALANLLWQQGDKISASVYYRIASCLAEMNEDYAAAYLRAMHCLKQTDAGLAFLRSRVERLGSKSTAPVITLFQQLELLERTEEGFSILEKALASHPEDGALQVFAADTYMRYGKLERSAKHLQLSENSAKRALWLHSRAMLARREGMLDTALDMAREAASQEPLNLARHQLVASLLAQQEGRTSAIAYVRDVASRFPYYGALQEMLVNWMTDQHPHETEAALRHIIEFNPYNTWALRELAILLANQHRYEEAHTIMGQVLEIAPEQSASHSVLGFVCLRQGKAGDAREHLRHALELSIDNNYALNTLASIPDSLAERKIELDFIRQELARQVILGDSLLSFQSAGQSTLPPDELLLVLREAHSERPDLWQSWVALAAQLTDMGRMDEALDFIAVAIERFPMLPRLYLEQGRAYSYQGKRAECRNSLHYALLVSPDWLAAVRLYVGTIVDEGCDYERALQVLDKALNHNNDQAYFHALKADILRRLQQTEAAIDEAKSAIRLDPEPRWVWELLAQLGYDSKQGNLIEQMAQEIVTQRPNDVSGWIKAAEYLPDPEAALQAAQRSVELEPRSLRSKEMLLSTLLRQGRMRELENKLNELGKIQEIESVRAKIFGGELLPVSIRAYRARLMKARGDDKTAANFLRTLLDEDPNQFALWRELADWRDEARHRKAYLEAAEHMVRLAPNYHVAHGYLADALLKLERAQESIPHFQRALDLDPTYTFAGYQLADLHLENKQADLAAQALAQMGSHAHTAYGYARQVKISVHRKDQAAALQWARETWKAAGEREWPFQEAAESLCAAKWQTEMLDSILDCIAEGRCNNFAVDIWLKKKGNNRRAGSFYKEIREARKRDPQYLLQRGLINYLGDTKNVDLLARYLREFGQDVSQDLESWCLVGYAYLAQDKIAKVTEWMRDWRIRPEIPAWALDNLAVALRTLNRQDQAREVSLRSLEIAPANHDAKTWLAFDAVRAHRLEEAQELLAQVAPEQLRGYYRSIRTAIEGYLEAARVGDSRKALPSFTSLAMERKSNKGLHHVLRTLQELLLRRHTKSLWRPIRWLQFVMT